VLFGNEFDADERAEVGGGLLGGESDEAVRLRSDYRLSVECRKNDIQERGRADGVVHLADDQGDFVGVGH